MYDENVATSTDIGTKSLHLHHVSCQQACQTKAGYAELSQSLCTCIMNCGLTEQSGWPSYHICMCISKSRLWN